jgi:hypothetical protein
MVTALLTWAGCRRLGAFAFSEPPGRAAKGPAVSQAPFAPTDWPPGQAWGTCALLGVLDGLCACAAEGEDSAHTVRAPLPTLRGRKGVPNLSAAHAAEVDRGLLRCRDILKPEIPSPRRMAPRIHGVHDDPHGPMSSCPPLENEPPIPRRARPRGELSGWRREFPQRVVISNAPVPVTPDASHVGA